MSEVFMLYDETEQGTTRFVGFATDHARYDLAIVTTAHFYGKKLVVAIQSGRSAILNDDDAQNAHYIMDVFGISNEHEAEELSEFLTSNL